MRRDAGKGGIDVVVLEVEEHVRSPGGFGRSQLFSPDRSLQRPPFMDGKAAVEQDEISEVLRTVSPSVFS